jgi:hypothetical protein
MSNKSTTNQRIQALQAQISSLQDEELQALRDRRDALLHEIGLLDAEIAGFGGKSASRKNGAPAKKPFGKALALHELKELLAAAPDHTISLRKVGLELANVRTLSAANPLLLQMGGIGAWPTVTLLK